MNNNIDKGWEKKKAELLKDKDIKDLKKALEIHKIPRCAIKTEEKNMLSVLSIIPQSPEEAAKWGEAPYHISNIIVSEEELEKYFSPDDGLINKIGFFEIVKIVSELNMKSEIEEAEEKEDKKSPEILLDTSNVGDELSVVYMKKLKHSFPSFSNIDFWSRVPSRDVLHFLNLAETFYQKHKNYEEAFQCYFEAGRAYEKAIYREFEPVIQEKFIEKLTKRAKEIKRAAKNPRHKAVWKYYKSKKKKDSSRTVGGISLQFFKSKENDNPKMKKFKNKESVRTYIRRGIDYSKEINDKPGLKKLLKNMDFELWI